MDKDTTYTESQYSKGWIAANPGMFTTSVLEFLARHDSSEWEIGVRQTAGFFWLTANRLTAPAA